MALGPFELELLFDKNEIPESESAIGTKVDKI
jgi:hypothetical protein